MAHVEISEVSVVEVAETSPRRFSWLLKLEYQLGRLVEIPAAMLVVAEIVVLFAGVVSRYVLHAPLIWSDEARGCVPISTWWPSARRWRS
jgi:hypothetical protein